MKRTSLQAYYSRSNILKVIKLCGAVGGGFGLAAVLIDSFVFSAAPLSLYAILGIPLLTASLSILAGLAGILVDWLLGPRMSAVGMRRLVTFAAVVLILTVVGLFISRFGRTVQRQYIWGGLIGCGFGALITYLDYRLGSMRQRMTDLEKENRFLEEIAQKDRQLQEITKNLAVAEERNRMARELHDSVSQGLHSIIYAISSLRQHLQPGDGRTGDILAHLEKAAGATLEELRAMILELRPSLLDEHGLTEALKLHAELFAREHRLELSLDLRACPGLTPGQETAVYRIAQEALTNIGRHAGAARVGLSLRPVGGRALLCVEDDGRGFEPGQAGQSSGLANMAARCRENGGELSVESSREKGTVIEASFPTA